MPELAHRHLEQIVNAALIGLATESHNATSPAREHDIIINPQLASLMDTIAARSREAYRSFIDDPAFWPQFIAQSPVLHIGELPIASRPVSRAKGGDIAFHNLRAIPWVFSWTQMRYNLPGWYGIGTAFAEHVLEDDAMLALCTAAYEHDGAFRAFIDNAQQEMARARLNVARWYMAGTASANLHDQLHAEFDRTRTAILAITGQQHLLDNNPVIQQSIRERNPDTDIINALQVELLRRWRGADEQQRSELRPLILLSVNALAAAMQSTG